MVVFMAAVRNGSDLECVKGESEGLTKCEERERNGCSIN